MLPPRDATPCLICSSYTYLMRLWGYMLRETTPLYILGVATFCLMLSIDMMVSWANFLIRNNATLSQVGQLMVLKLPYFLHLALPIATIFAVLLATGRLAKDSELKAAYSLGTSPMRLLRPLLLLGLIVSGLTLLNNGYLEPKAQPAYDKLVNSFYYSTPPAATQNNVAYRTTTGDIYYAGKIQAVQDNRAQAELSGILIRKKDGTTVTAVSGRWDSDTKTWLLYDAQEVGEETRSHGTLTLPFEISNDATSNLTEDAQLTLNQLWQRLQEQRKTGAETRDSLFAFHKRMADGFSALIFVLIAGVLGLQLHGRAAGFGWTIVLIVMFWAMWTLSSQLFREQVLSPIAAAYFTIALGAFIGGILAWWRLR
jgi:lipopolysaccharide export system permease protein